MSRSRARRVKPGDVFELAIPGSFIAIQAIGKHRNHGWAARVSASQTAVPRADATGIDREPDRYVVLMGDLAFEEAERRLRYVGRATLPEQYKDRFPVFRASASYESDGRHEPNSWWLDDGQREWFVGELSEEEKHYPYRQFTPALALMQLIEHGWDPEWEFKGPEARKFATPVPSGANAEQDAFFFLVFRTKEDAYGASEEISTNGMFSSLTVDAIEDGTGRYVVAARAPSPADLDSMEALLQRIATDYNGDYDGNELPVNL